MNCRNLYWGDESCLNICAYLLQKKKEERKKVDIIWSMSGEHVENVWPSTNKENTDGNRYHTE